MAKVPIDDAEGWSGARIYRTTERPARGQVPRTRRRGCDRGERTGPVLRPAKRQTHHGEVEGLHAQECTRTITSMAFFLRHWNDAERKQAILEELEEQGVLLDALQQEVGVDFDPFDLICTWPSTSRR